jgi:hypothetical protein
MSKQHINTGIIANDGRGDGLRTAFTKVNENFDELYQSNTALLKIGNYTDPNGSIGIFGNDIRISTYKGANFTINTAPGVQTTIDQYGNLVTPGLVSAANGDISFGNFMSPVVLANNSMFVLSEQISDSTYYVQGSLSYPETYQFFVIKNTATPNNNYSYAVTLDGVTSKLISDVTIVSRQSVIANNDITAGGDITSGRNLTLGGDIKFTTKGNVYDNLHRPLFNVNALDIDADGGTSTAVFSKYDIGFDGGSGESVFGAYEAALDGGVSFNNKHSASLIDGGGANQI